MQKEKTKPGNPPPDIATIKHLYEQVWLSSSDGVSPNDGKYYGLTDFFRFPDFQAPLIDHLCTLPRQDNLRLLVVPGSIGCEAVTLAILAKEKGLFNKHGRVEIHTLDISEKFTAIAASGCYHKEALWSMRWRANNAEKIDNAEQIDYAGIIKRYFNELAQDQESGPRFVSVAPEIMDHIKILPPADALYFEEDEPYDAVISNVLMQYVDNELEYFEKLCSLSRKLIHCMPARSFTANGVSDFVKRSGLKILDYPNFQPKELETAYRQLPIFSW